MGWAGNRVSPQITATPRFPVGSRVLLKPADPKGRKKGMMVDCDGVVISVQETTTKYALRKLWRGVPVCVEIKFTARSSSTPSTRYLLDGVAVRVSHDAIQPARPRHRREMT